MGHVARMGDRRSAYRVLVKRTDGKRPFGRPGHIRIILKWLFNTRMGKHGLYNSGSG